MKTNQVFFANLCYSKFILIKDNQSVPKYPIVIKKLTPLCLTKNGYKDLKYGYVYPTSSQMLSSGLYIDDETIITWEQLMEKIMKRNNIKFPIPKRMTKKRILKLCKR